MNVARKLILMMLLKVNPQDIPYSVSLMVSIIILHLFSGIVVMESLLEGDTALVRMLLNIGILLFFSYLLLSLMKHRQRLVQTVTSLVGTGILFNLLAWPLLSQLSVDNLPEQTMSMLSLIMLLLLSWEVMVTAHIYRHALNMQMLNAIMLALGLFFISLALTQMIFTDT